MRIGLVVVVVGLAGCGGKKDGAPHEMAPAEPAAVEVVDRTPGTPVNGSVLVEAPIVIGVLLPASAKLEEAEARAKWFVMDSELRDAQVHVESGTAQAMGWHAETAFIPGRAEAAAEFEGMAPMNGVAFGMRSGRPALPTFLALARVAHALAGELHGWIALSNMAVYSPRTFTKYVLARPGDARKLILVEPLATADGGDLAALGTVGLRARGIPELIVQGVPSGEFETVATLLNATAQTLLENPTVVDGTIAVDFGVLGESWDAASIRANGGTARIMWRAQWTDERDPDLRPEMDPSGPQITLSVAGASTQSAEALMIAVNQFVGAPDDNPVRRGDDAELEAAAKRARTELAALIPVFSKGPRATGERLSVKCGFIEGEVTEWMWVDVIKLTKTHVDGTLDNRPSVVKLTEGARVQVPYELVADYIHTKADGSKVGGYSVEINQRRGR